ncbi:LysR family transcriptional regulator [Achromobacter sp. Marseille-Q0513]|uniref:LysR family transcriptional regulator n=1 Tax=Achromobacter sp. Marseille-Q0513 TaxID=2829161 RepID=UPI001B986061|nr:LysR family transcriptional regulator [Achromobacter sp. Marseille-Q0513]MBR8656144.1 LysR family transcriptional regulator [Achromobacter sp. Marseille-Q0513]
METMDRQLRYFICIAELGSLSRAADALDQTQSGLSRQLASLEARIGQPLFLRTGRGVELTEAGKLLYDATQPAYRGIDLAVERMRHQGVTQGTLRLAAVHTLSYYYTADLVAGFVSAHPSVNLSIMGRSSPEVVALVESGKADLGLVYDSAVDSGTLESCPLFDDDMALIVRHDSPLSGPQDLAALSLRLVGFPPHYALRRMIQSAGLQPDFAAEAETIDAMLRLVSSGVGDCILPARIPDKLLDDYGLRKLPVARPLLRRRVVAVTQAGKPRTPLLKEFLSRVEQLAGELRGGAPA